MASPVKIGIVGLGRHGARYANHLLKGDSPNARLVAVHRRNEDEGRAYADEHGLRFHPTLFDMLGDDEVEAVVVTTPAKYHAPITIAAADAGKHVICEKPMGRTVEECREMNNAARREGVKLMIGQTVRYAPLLGALRDNLSLVGDLYGFHACMRQEKSPIEWHFDPEMSGGGAVIEIGVHLFDSMRFVTGRNIVRVLGEGRDTYGVGVETYASGIVWFEGGATGTFDLAKCVDGRVTRFDAVGAKGSLIADLTTNTLDHVVGRERHPMDAPPNIPTIPLLIDDFVDAIRNDTATAVGGMDGLHTVAITEAFYRSAKSGAPESVEV
ncbi:MAG: Gfo/Idh/MocA family oxidoreductase [Candidatus Poribacteria bacterium]|nr:Gfo/Idh/MocA family oxidoreductase [Candidatus Poribacteria bacterium]